VNKSGIKPITGSNPLGKNWAALSPKKGASKVEREISGLIIQELETPSTLGRGMSIVNRHPLERRVDHLWVGGCVGGGGGSFGGFGGWGQGPGGPPPTFSFVFFFMRSFLLSKFEHHLKRPSTAFVTSFLDSRVNAHPDRSASLPRLWY
jgi:hypothetical protein